MPDTIVVGAGICGLQLAALLAADGEEVLVLEKLSHIGGRAFLWEKDGYTVDNGIHLVRFGPKSAMAKVFAHMGKPIDFAGMGKSYVAFPDGKVVDFPTSPGGFLTTKLMTVGERLKAIGLMLSVKRRDPASLLDTPVAEWMDREGISGGMRKYLCLVSASMQVCPFIERSSAGEMLLNMKSLLEKGYSAMYPTKGWRYIYDSLVETIETKGEIRLETEVARVVVENGRAVGVELGSGERIDAARVVVSLPGAKVLEVVEETAVPEDFAALLKSIKPTAGVVLDYGVKKKISGDDGLWYLWEPMSFGMFTSNLCPDLAPPGRQLLTWFAPADLSDMEDPEKAAALEAELEAGVKKVFPALEENIEWRRAMRLKTVDGVEVNVDQHRGKRPGYRVPGVEGLFLAGDSLKGPGAGGDVGHESVIECYREVAGREV